MTEVFVGAGDIGTCDANSEATARLLDSIGGTVFTLGDHAYPTGSEYEFQTCYEPTWGRHRSRTRPTPGNHDYEQRGASAYFNYFGANAGFGGTGYYSFELGPWLVLSLNSNASIPAQVTWLKNILGRSKSRCTLAYWHHPLYASGPSARVSMVRDLWDVLYDAGAEVVLGAHDHLYERFAPQDDEGRLDPERGIRQFVVGTGGAAFHASTHRMPNSELLLLAHGVLKLTLSADGYEWEFITVSGQGDAGSGRCH
jgi:acid phosphatase type 7